MKAVCPAMPDTLLQQLQGALPAIALSEESALNTAFSNDVSPDAVFAQQVVGYGRPGDVFLGINTSGNARNVLYAAQTARALGLSVLGLTGTDGGVFAAHTDVCIRVPERQTYRVQEMHLPVYHALCAQLEQNFFEERTI